MNIRSSTLVWLVASLFFVSVRPNQAWAKVPAWAKFMTSATEFAEVHHRGYDVSADFSSIQNNIDWSKITKASVNFDLWPSMKVDGIIDMKVVEVLGPDHLIVWVHMASSGSSSKHFYDVRIFDQVHGAGTFGNTFQLIRPQKTYRNAKGQMYPNDPAFSVMEGSWYLSRQGLAANQVSIRYFIDSTVSSGIPAFLVGPIASKSMKRSAIALIVALAKLCQIR